MSAAKKEVVSWDNVVAVAMPKFERIARAENLVRWEEESQFAMQAISKNMGLQKCAVESIQNAIINVAAVGLTLNPADGYAYLVPEYDKQSGSQLCQLRISFKGLVKVATDSGSIKWVKAEVVKQEDDFTYCGPCTMPTHQMNPFADRGETIGVYCVAKTHEDDYLVDVMSLADIKKIQACAKTPKIWSLWFDEMCKKAVIKRADKQWPKTDRAERLNKTISVINETEGGFDPMQQLENIAAEILDLVEKDDLVEAGKIWCECDEQEQRQLWVAKTKGGFFTMQEKDKIREASTAYRKSELIDNEAEQ